MKCVVCRREPSVGDCVTFHLQPDERALWKEQTGEDAEAWHYCKACFRVLSDPTQGAELLKGMLQVSLGAQGVPQANQLAAKFHSGLTTLVVKARKKQ